MTVCLRTWLECDREQAGVVMYCRDLDWIQEYEICTSTVDYTFCT